MLTIEQNRLIYINECMSIQKNALEIIIKKKIMLHKWIGQMIKLKNYEEYIGIHFLGISDIKIFSFLLHTTFN